MEFNRIAKQININISEIVSTINSRELTIFFNLNIKTQDGIDFNRFVFFISIKEKDVLSFDKIEKKILRELNSKLKEFSILSRTHTRQKAVKKVIEELKNY